MVTTTQNHGGELVIQYDETNIIGRLRNKTEEDTRDLCMDCEKSLYRWYEKYGAKSGVSERVKL